MVCIKPIEAYWPGFGPNSEALLRISDTASFKGEFTFINGLMWPVGLIALHVSYDDDPGSEWEPERTVMFRDYSPADIRRVQLAKDKNLSLLAFGLCNIIEGNKDWCSVGYYFQTSQDALIFKLSEGHNEAT